MEALTRVAAELEPAPAVPLLGEALPPEDEGLPVLGLPVLGLARKKSNAVALASAVASGFRPQLSSTVREIEK